MAEVHKLSVEKTRYAATMQSNLRTRVQGQD